MDAGIKVGIALMAKIRQRIDTASLLKTPDHIRREVNYWYSRGGIRMNLCRLKDKVWWDDDTPVDPFEDDGSSDEASFIPREIF